MNSSFDAFVAPARVYPQIWRLGGGLILAAAIYLGPPVALYYGAQQYLSRDVQYFVLRGLSGTGTPLETSILFATFVFMALGTVAAARVFHKRGIGSLFGPGKRLLARNFLIAAGIVGLLAGLSVMVVNIKLPAVPNLPVILWLSWLPAMLTMLLIQITAEELFFRGYLQQQLAARFNRRWVWMVLPSIVFGLGHYQLAEMGENAWLIVVDTTIFGLIAADLTARTGNLGAVMGLHFANNFFAILVVGMQGTITGFSLFVTPFTALDSDVIRPLVLFDIGALIVGYALFLFIFARIAR